MELTGHLPYPVRMEITREHPLDGNVLTIRRYEPGRIVVDDQELTTSFILFGSELHTEWPPARPSELQTDHLDRLLAFEPELILLGTGEHLEHPGVDMLGYVMGRGVGFEIMDTGSACRTYNILVGEGRRVAAGFLMIEDEV